MVAPATDTPSNLNLEVLDAVNPDEWDALVRQLNAGLFHSYFYAQTIYANNHGEPFYARFLNDQGNCVGLCLGNIQYSSLPVVRSIFKQAHLTALPAVSEPFHLTAAHAALSRALSEREVMNLQVDSYDAPAQIGTPEDAAAKKIHRAEFRLDLTPALETLWANLAGTRRTQIRRVEREGLKCRQSWEWNDVNCLAELTKKSSLRREQKTGELFETPTSEKLRSLWEHLVQRRLASVYLLESDSEVLSANLIAIWNKRAYNLLAGSSPKGFKIGAASGLYWEIIKSLHQEGAVEFNLGGVAVDADQKDHPGRGLYDFKRDFGGALVSCNNLHYTLRASRYAIYQKLSAFRDRIGKKRPHKN